MKKVRICFLASLCLCVCCFNSVMAEDVPTPGQQDITADVAAAPPSTSANVETMEDSNSEGKITNAEAVEDSESEGEITYSASVEPVSKAQKPDIDIMEARICEGIIEREPVAPGDVFPSDINQLFCFSRVKSSESTEIKHIWYCNGEPVAEVPLSIGASSGWRTFSSKNISAMDKGNWKVEILSAGGTPMKTIQFIIN